MPDDKPLIDVIVDEVADAIYQIRTAMVAGNEVMKYSHLRQAVRAVLVARLPWITASRPDSDGLKPAERIYAAYPRKEGKLAALQKIEVALRTVPASELLAKVQAYAAAVAKWPAHVRYQDGRDTVPHARTWFSQGRWMDDPKTWERNDPPDAPPSRPLMR